MNYRQGDIGLFSIDSIPEKAKKLKDKTLAYGEVTGHSHRFEDENLIERFAYKNKTYLQVFNSVPLVHEEHKPLIIEKGIYEQIQEKEYSPFDEAIRKVVD
jgi:hypothetical protein